MQISSQEFHHLIRVLHCLDGWEVESIIQEEYDRVSFCRDPIRYFLACSDETREALWDAMLNRHNRSTKAKEANR